MTSHIIGLVDMDCFYVQVEERDNPHIKGVPAAVVQYNSWKGGGIIAVNYEARAKGVTRQMRGDEAKEHCPEIQLVQVPVQRGKANLTKYRDAGREVISVLCQFSDKVERASVDEAYIDLTEAVERKLSNLGDTCIDVTSFTSTWVVGYDAVPEKEEDTQVVRHNGLKEWLCINQVNVEELSACYSDEMRLSAAALLCEEMRAAVLQQTGFKCSAGISHSKMLSKLACGLHKPNQQTILPQTQVPSLWTTTPLRKVRNLGGKLGESLKEWFGCVTMSDISNLSLLALQSRYDNKTACWLQDIGNGIDKECVRPRQLAKSIGCGKNFPNKSNLNTQEKVKHWLQQLSEEMAERLQEDMDNNNRRAQTLCIGLRLGDEKMSHMSRSCPLHSYSAVDIASTALGLIKQTNKASIETNWSPPIINISLSATKFGKVTYPGSSSIQDLFKKAANQSSSKMKLMESVKSDQESTTRQDPSCSKKQSLSNQFRNFFKKSEETAIEKISFVNDLPEENVNQITDDCSDKTVIESDNCLDEKSNEKNHLSVDNDCKSFFKTFMLKKKMEENSKLIASGKLKRETISNSIKHDFNNENETTDCDMDDHFPKNPIDRKSLSKCPSEIFSSFSENSNDFPTVTGDCSGQDNSVLSNSQERILLLEMFPNLNDVDPSVLACLPESLQKEFKLLTKELNENVKDKASDTNTSQNNPGSKLMDDNETETNLNKNKLKETMKASSSSVNQDLKKEDMITCPECGQAVWVFEILEHSDYHMAVQLRLEQRVNGHEENTQEKQVVQAMGKKRGRKPAYKNMDTKCPKIDSYFSIK